jgi:hypothetical protein
MKALGKKKGELGNLYMDDGVCGAWGDLLEEAGEKIEEMFNRAGRPKDWGKQGVCKKIV